MKSRSELKGGRGHLREGTSEKYMEVLAALGSILAKNKDDLAMARYNEERLRKKLEEAEKEITNLKGTS